jgi:Uma2 family endonuclease
MDLREARRLFTVDEYHRMAESGILDEDDRVELIGGEIIRMSPTGSRHAASVSRLNRIFNKRLGNEAIVRVQDPILLSDLTEPEPDVALLRPREDFYSGGHPRPEDVLLVVEVAETSLSIDRNAKVPLYALSGIPDAWVVDLAGASITTYSRPEGGTYRETRSVGRDGYVSSESFPGLTVAVEEVLG